MSYPCGYRVPEVDLAIFDENLFCSSCGFVSRLVVQTGLCEHLYCEKCLQGKVLSQVNPVCVKCKKPLQHTQYFPDNCLRREIEGKTVHCRNIAVGCNWSGELKIIDAHQCSCPYRPLRCGNDGCTITVPANQLIQHKEQECPHRQVECEYCGSSMNWDAYQEHEQNCPNVPVTCDRCGKIDIPRGKLFLHSHPFKGDCNRMYCPFRTHGCSCDDLLNRESLLKHLSENVAGHQLILLSLMESVAQEREAVAPSEGGIGEGLLAVKSEVAAHSWALTTHYKKQEELVTDVKALVVVLSEAINGIEQVSLAQTQENAMLRNRVERLEGKVERLEATLLQHDFSLNTLWRFIGELLRLAQRLVSRRLP